MNHPLEANSVGRVTLEDVRRAIQELEAAGTSASLRSVHAKLGRGSRTTILKLYAGIQLTRDGLNQRGGGRS